MLEVNNLKFLGFNILTYIKSLYKNMFPEEETQLSLRNWIKLETEDPQVFLGMYQFWVCKTKVWFIKEHMWKTYHYYI